HFGHALRLKYFQGLGRRLARWQMPKLERSNPPQERCNLRRLPPPISETRQAIASQQIRQSRLAQVAINQQCLVTPSQRNRKVPRDYALAFAFDRAGDNHFLE